MFGRPGIAVAGLSLALASPAEAGPREWEVASDVGRAALVGAAVGIPALDGDWKGSRDAALSMGITALLTAGMKALFRQRRPDGSDNKSFPSGHTSVSFAAAATISERHGWETGLPAHATAALVGWARVEANKHYPHDVVAGAVLGEMAGWSLTGERD